ncbi:MAG TPA: transketolase C-terminal domain-containing protein, partial [Bacillota bacterium]|nr:transketolase C-terminal domain-containing protein [Bacillota bacterium]
YLRQIPNMTVMAPHNDQEFRDMIFTALQLNQPVAIRYPRRNVEGMPVAGYQMIPVGKGEIIRNGREVALLAVGAMVKPAKGAAEQLQLSGINCTVVNARYIKPLDEELILQLAAEHRILVTLEENITAGGFGSAVLELLARQQITNVYCRVLGVPDQFVAHGATDILFKLCGLDIEGICRTVLELYGPVLNQGKQAAGGGQ